MEKVTFSRFDIVEHLEEDEDIKAYFSQVLEDDDKDQLQRVLKNILKAKFINQTSKELNIDRDLLIKAFDEEETFNQDTILKLLNSFGFSKQAIA